MEESEYLRINSFLSLPDFYGEGRKRERKREITDMEWSDDKVIETIMDTHTDVKLLVQKSCDLDDRVKVLEKDTPDKDWKHYGKKTGKWSAILAMFSFMAFEVYNFLRGNP